MDALLETYIKLRKKGIPSQFIFQNPDLIDPGNYYNIISYSSQKGDIDVIKYIFEHCTINISYNDNYLFRHACRDGYLEICKILYNSSVNQDNLNIAFAWACECGHYDVALWLYDKSVDIHSGGDHAFKWSCINGHLNICQWLYSVDPTVITCIDNNIDRLITACKSHHIEMWLLSIKMKNNNIT